ncbi:hypothetical protein FRC12_015008 [Ceratobasidium sp. 428]|nr:hypothetical protein FRC12_015008 [Ceratobasidium sp. 428]
MLGWTPASSCIPTPQGASLFEVQNPLHLLMAIHDALVGIMALTEAGKIHCDISAFNLLLVDPEKHYKDQGWMKAPKTQPSPTLWDRSAKEAIGTSGNATSSTSARDGEGVCPRLDRVTELKRGLVCVVHDTEFTIDEERPAGAAYTDWTGSPAFISGQLLKGFATGKHKVTRMFIHDVESLFWVLVWVVAHRSQKEDTWQVSKEAEAVMRKLSESDISKLSEYKRDKICNGGGFQRLVYGFNNDLCQDLAPVIGQLADFLSAYLYFQPQSLGYVSRFDTLRNAQAQLHKELTSCSRSTTFSFLFDILDPAIATLEAKHLAINFGRR